MNKQISFEYEGKEYTLEYTRSSVQTMERRGFVLDEIDKRPITMIQELFAGAFLTNHSQIKRDKVNRIFEAFGDKQKLLEALVTMYRDAADSLMEEPDEGKNLSWTPNWDTTEN